MKCLKACSAGCFVVGDDGAVVAAAPEAGRARRTERGARERDVSATDENNKIITNCLCPLLLLLLLKLEERLGRSARTQDAVLVLEASVEFEEVLDLLPQSFHLLANGKDEMTLDEILLRYIRCIALPTLQIAPHCTALISQCIT